MLSAAAVADVGATRKANTARKNTAISPIFNGKNSFLIDTLLSSKGLTTVKTSTSKNTKKVLLIFNIS